MNSEKISKVIKDIRAKEGLTQEKLAKELNVTFQAVSKWENGKSIPDIEIINKICQKYNIDINELLNGNKTKKDQHIKVIIVLCIVLVLFIIAFIAYIAVHKDDYEFKTLDTTCNSFAISGSAAFNHEKSNIYISNINYCGGEDETIYNNIECSLYEKHDDSEILINRITSDSSSTLEEFLKDVVFKIDNYDSQCSDFKNASLYLLISAYDSEDKITSYKVPLSMDNECTK